MKKFCYVVSSILVLFVMTACSNHTNELVEISKEADANKEETTVSSNDRLDEEMEESNKESVIGTEELSMKITVNKESYSVDLYDNETSRELISRLPLTLEMQPMNGNEKYVYLEESLPTNSSVPSSIHSGDLMLFGNNCLVLFHDDFTTNYSYTPIGHLENVENLASILGSGSITIEFSK